MNALVQRAHNGAGEKEYEKWNEIAGIRRNECTDRLEPKIVRDGGREDRGEYARAQTAKPAAHHHGGKQGQKGESGAEQRVEPCPQKRTQYHSCQCEAVAS